MKVFLTLIIAVTFSFANYSIYYGGLKLGVISSLDTIKDNYLKIQVTNSIARLLLGKKQMIFYNDKYTNDKKNGKIKYKKDKYYIIDIIRKSISDKLINGTIFISEDKYIQITKGNDYQFKYISRGKTKANGSIKVFNKDLISLIDEKNSLKIIKN